MPLHDWTDPRGWDSLHLVWQNQLLDHVQPRLPAGYRAYLGAVPALTVDGPAGKPDLSVREWTRPEPAASATAVLAPDSEAVATFSVDPQRVLQVELHGRLIAAVEIVSPRNKDRPAARERYLNRYLGYIRQSVHLLLIDVLPRPADFSFADALAASVGFPLAATPAPAAVSLRVGESVPEGTLLAVWRRPMAVGRPLPAIPLPLSPTEAVPIDLEHTYREAAKRSYLDDPDPP